MYIHKPLRITKGNNSHRNGSSSLLFIIIICPVDMNVYARFDEIPSITLEDIKKTKRYGWTDVKTVYPPTNTVCGGYKDANGIANSEDPDQTAPLGAQFVVCPELLWIIMVPKIVH